ncbi:MAG: sigma-70 family RNA polymerase sigma factor [Planctomycetota bacterium]
MPPQDSSHEFELLLQRCRADDRQAIDELFERFYPTVQRMVRVSLRTEFRNKRPWLNAVFSSSDIVQSVFLSILRSTSTFDGRHEGALVKYFATATKNRIIDEIRHYEASRRSRGREVGEREHSVRDERTGPATHSLINDQMERLQAAVDALPEQERQLVRGRLEQDLSYQELADQLGYGSLDSARRAFLRASARLALSLQEEEHES